MKDYLDRGVQTGVEDGLFVINHAEGKLRLYLEEVEGLRADLAMAIKNKAVKPRLAPVKK